LKKEHPIVAHSLHESDSKVRLFTGSALLLQKKIVDICDYLLKAHVKPHRIAILCREHGDYQGIASMLRHEKLPVCVIKAKESVLPWHKLREVHAMLRIFDGEDSLSAEEVDMAWKALPDKVQQHATTQALWHWLDSYQDKEAIVRARYEWRAEIRELSHEVSKKSGQGIHLGTMHSAKGLEFDTVIVFAGKQGQIDKKFEELRLRYVAMTRAERNLIFMQADNDYPWFKSLDIATETLAFEVHEQAQKDDVYVCSMKDVNLGFMGRKSHPIQTSSIDMGYSLTLNSNGIILYENKTVGQLSGSMMKQLKHLSVQGWSITEIKVHAIIRRHQEDEAIPEKCEQNTWDVIIPEIKLQQNSYG
jgi:ATP-dependent DNA helicase RecQ